MTKKGKLEDATSIFLNKKTRDMLRELGKKGETYDEIITYLMAIRTECEQAGLLSYSGSAGVGKVVIKK